MSDCQFSHEFAGFREICHFPTVSANWLFSREKLVKLAESLDQCLSGREDKDLFTVAVSGSYGRMEASQQSDLDFSIISSTTLDKTASDEIVAEIHREADKLGMRPANTSGPFAKAHCVGDLVSGLGSKQDNHDTIAVRMLMLMESKAVFGCDQFSEFQGLILDKYTEYLVTSPNKEALLLLNDLIRYFREICVNYQHTFENDNQKWVLRNIKLRHSRVILYAGLLFLVLNASTKKENKVSYLKQEIKYTPLERIARVYDEAKSGEFNRVLGLYDMFLQRISDPVMRGKLNVDYDSRYTHEHYREMRITSEALQSELFRFILAQRGRWSERIFEYLVF